MSTSATPDSLPSSSAPLPAVPKVIPTITNIQALRGIASLMVIIGHIILIRPNMGVNKIYDYVGAFSSSGVDLFFVISGFIIATVAMKAGRDATSTRGTIVWNFTVKRLTRIYPVYWVVLALAVMLSPYVSFSPDWLERTPIWKQALLLTHINSHIMAAWSLGFEIYFYAVVSVALLISPRHVMKVLTGWAVATALLIYFNVDGLLGIDQAYPLTILVFEFVFGMGIAVLIDRGFYRYATSCAVVGALGFVLGVEILQINVWYKLTQTWRVLCAGVPSALLVYGLVAAELGNGWKMDKFWVKLGDPSYSVYIWHQFLLYSMATVCEATGLFKIVPGFYMLLFWLGICLWVGFSSYRLIELPAQNYLNRRLLKRRLVSA
jgi:peptidoglycan/LPS O-acetylase OafA/YrhL